MSLRTASALVLASTAVTAVDNEPFGNALIPEMLADASIIDVNGTFYCYATTDGMGHHLDTAGPPVVWKSKDFQNWSFQGQVYPDDFDAKYWAPSIPVFRNGQWFSYPTLNGQVCVSVAKSLEGPFLAPDGRHINRKNGLSRFPLADKRAIDAEILIDDDGSAYMIWSRRHIAKLKPDLLTLDGEPSEIATKRQGYSEGPGIFKRKGIYYYYYTLGGDEQYQYAYMMSRTSPMGPWEAPEKDIILTSDPQKGIYGPGHGSCFQVQGTDQWIFIYLEYGRSSTNRQTFADRLEFNADGTIRPLTLTKQGVGALRTPTHTEPNLALGAIATASTVRPDEPVKRRKSKTLDRIDSSAPGNAVDGSNGSRWQAADKDPNPWWQVDLGSAKTVKYTEIYFLRPTEGHAYSLEYSLNGSDWKTYGGHDNLIIQSPHVDTRTVQARYFRVKILKGLPGIWEFRAY
jgi:beta-xylosidase